MGLETPGGAPRVSEPSLLRLSRAQAGLGRKAAADRNGGLETATADKTILTSKRVASCSMVRQLANGWKLGMYWHASRYSLHGGMFQELSPSLQIEMAERTRKGPIGDIC